MGLLATTFATVAIMSIVPFDGVDCIRSCGIDLANMVEDHCSTRGGVYMPSKRNPIGDDMGSPYPTNLVVRLLSNAREKRDLLYHRAVRRLADDCCHRSCPMSELNLYCHDPE